MNDLTLTYAAALKQAAGELLGASVPDPETDARLLLFHFFELDLTGYLLCRDQTVLTAGDEAQEKRLAGFREAVERRCRRVPLQHILGKAWFYGSMFEVSPDVLIPRPETEILVRKALEEIGTRACRVLDLCTGSGCIAVTLKREAPQIRCLASDISPKALELAQRNASAQGVCVDFVRSDLFDAFDGNERFDLIVSNPPYIATGEISALQPEVRLYDPVLALDGGCDGLDFYRRICREGFGFLNENGALFMEMGAAQGSGIRTILADAGFGDIRIIRDLNGKDRVIGARKF